MTTPNLAKIEQERDLNKAWAHEAHDFTPWLADNISELGEALGMELGDPQTEVQVGGYSLDILATDRNSEKPVIIENQLGATDHTHLGQLLTYAAGLDGGTIVWVTGNFRDEHRQALDWLNQRTYDETRFFGVVVELWRIGNSPLAPHFRVVASPNGWIKIAKPPNPPVILNTSGKFRQSLRDTCDARGIKYSGRPGGNWPWLNFEYPIKNVRYGAIWHKGKPGLEMIIERPGGDGLLWNQEMFNALELHRSEIDDDLVESEKDEPPVWESTESKVGTRIILCREGSIYNDTESWADFQDWMIQKLHKFRQVITPRLKAFSTQEQSTLE